MSEQGRQQANNRFDSVYHNQKFTDPLTRSRQFLHAYQKRTLNFDEQKPAEQADTLRFCLVQQKLVSLGLHGDVEKSKASIQPDFALKHKLQTLEVQYSKLIDSKERLNSYAAPALSLSQNFRNESEKWKCNLDLTKLKDKVNNSFNIEQEVPDNEYLKLLILMKEKDPFEAKKINFKKAKAENVNKASDSAIFNIFDENLLDQPNIISRNSVEDVKTNNVRSFSNIKPKDDFLANRPTQKRNDREPFVPNLGNVCNSTVNVQNNFSSSSFASYFGQNNFQGSSNSCVVQKEVKPARKSCGKYPWENINNSEVSDIPKQNFFKTASEQLTLNNFKKFGAKQPEHAAANLYGNQKRSLGARRGISSKFTPPIRRDEERYDETNNGVRPGLNHRSSDAQTKEENPYEELMMDERMKNIDVKMVELIMNEIMDNGLAVTWDDIAGLKLAKSTIQEIVVWPMLRPDIFTGLRGPPKGLLLFGPPGTGKTMIGKCIASQSQSTFFSISASSLTSKWVGEGEKMVRAMFAVAKCHQPAVIFIDEIDSLLTQRSESEHESSRRLKTEFLVQLDGATSEDDERLLVVGATNRPQELDEAARRRLVKRLYIPLPESKAREQIIINLLSDQKHTLTSSDIEEICEKADGYSGADMANLCREAALGPIRSLNFVNIQQISVDEVRPIMKQDFLSALDTIRASVSKEDLHLYEDWNRKYGINPK